MKLKDFFTDTVLDWVNESPLFEMAWKRHDAEVKMTKSSYQIINHLIKILKWEDKLNYNKHCRDITGWLDEIQRISLKNGKTPDSKFSYKCLITDNRVNLDDVNKRIKKLSDYHNLKVLLSNEDVYLKIINIIQQVVIDIEKEKFEDIKDYL